MGTFDDEEDDCPLLVLRIDFIKSTTPFGNSSALAEM